MKRFVAITLVLFLALQACKTKETPDNQEAIKEIKQDTTQAPIVITNIFASPVTYNGTLPYSDTTEQDYQITFAENGRYVDIKHLTTKASLAYIDKGYWLQENDTLITTKSSSGEKRKFAYQDGNLIKLDMNGHRYTGPKSENFTIKMVEGDNNRHLLVQKQTEGIDYISFGTEPNWIFEIDMDKNLRFKIGNDSLIAQVPEPVPSNGHKSYVIKNGSTNFNVIIKEEFNIDKMSGRMYPYLTEIHYKNKVYTAGGVDLSELP